MVVEGEGIAAPPSSESNAQAGAAKTVGGRGTLEPGAALDRLWMFVGGKSTVVATEPAGSTQLLPPMD